ncbi:MAG: tRNA (adenosine(37)-N6)-threonylcarbamoyltransferase complex dimerization subunit type 1 TsaB [Ktedonobacteraceae bacterium]|nr:tRNA (adenosine(37)-N6)-threonylcarbamoyltransferase complex dimerization subunit type 1 TsaB [Ktedonobacteraceae bacterium]
MNYCDNFTMLLLALDTSTRQASVALCSEDDLYAEYTWHIGNNHSVELLTSIQRLFAECSIALQQVDAVAVATGPGSFNGVRVALATAKTLAFALKKPLVGVSTLDCIAAQQQHWMGSICAVLEAGRSELYAACYVFEKQHKGDGSICYTMQHLSEYLLLTPLQLVERLHEQIEASSFLFCGELSAASRQVLHAQMGEQSCFVSSVEAARPASTLAMLAQQRLHRSEVDDPLLLEPLYLRRPSITTSTRKQVLLSGLQ